MNWVGLLGLALACAEPPAKSVEVPEVKSSSPAREVETKPITVPVVKGLARPPARAEDLKVSVDGHDLVLLVDDGECVVVRANNRSSRLRTGLQGPCYWSRWFAPTRSLDYPNGRRFGAGKGDVQAFRFSDQSQLILALIGDPIDEPRVVADEISVQRIDMGFHCGGALRLILIEESEMALGEASSNGFNCVELPPEIKALWVLSHPKE